MHRLVLCALLAFAPAARAQKPVETERKEREEEREREARERGQREYRERSEKGKAAPGDDEALYALGAILGSRVNGYGLSKKELQRVERGFADAAEDRKLELRDPDLEEWGPKVDAMLQRRGNPRIAGEKERGRKVADLESKKPGAERLPGGIVFVPEWPGDGPRPAATDRVRVRYEGRLPDGTRFDQNEGAEFRLDQVIPCWTQGVQKIGAGGRGRLVCPAATAYGDHGRPPQIPGGATLIFDVELLGIVK
jgi:FKBP-type peptidyl-prolyl cis-trans isomerase FkpA